MNKVYVLGGLRSHIGLKNGAFKNIPAEILAAKLLSKLQEKYATLHFDEIIGGNAVGTGGNITRLAALEAGLSEQLPCLTVDVQCASGAAAIELAYAKLRSGLADVIVAGGFESSSMQPTRVYHSSDPRYTPEGFQVAQFSPETNSPLAMLEGAERTAKQAGIGRQELEQFTLRSHRLASAAQEQQVFTPFIVSLFNSTRDEGIRPRMNERLVARMPLLLGEGTSLTAATSCLINDGAAFVILANASYVAQAGVKPLAEIIGAADGGVDPQCSPLGALAVGEKVLNKAGLRMDEMAAVEYNEAFAVISALFARRYPALLPRYNQWGGALAYGHPYGASGAILLLHLLAELAAQKSGYGLMSIAGAGGMGTALLLKKV